MRSALFCLMVLVAGWPQPVAAQDCRLALVLALDVSGSVNEIEYAQQLNGLAAALETPEVRAAILSDVGAPVELAVFEWSSQNHQFLVQPWTTLDSPDALDRAVARIRAYRKQRAGLKTALSTALLFAGELLREKSACWSHTIDVSGDGKNNIGPPPREVYRLDTFDGVTVNALVVGDPASARELPSSAEDPKGELQRYFERDVIHGAGAFAMIAQGYEDYARAMQKKLLRELAVPILGASGHF